MIDISNFVDKIQINNSPLVKWIDMNDSQKAELSLFHYNYGWIFLVENKLITLGNNDVIVNYIANCYKHFINFVQHIEVESFFELFSERMANHREELGLVRQSQNKPNLYFPKYFYTKVFFQPLTTIKIDYNLFCEDDLGWSKFELSDMYAHQVNYIEKSIRK